MASGITVSDECKKLFEIIKNEKTYRYAVLRIKDEKEIVREYFAGRNIKYDQFLTDLQKGGADECRYGLFDFEYGTPEGCKKQKLVLICWCPETATIKNKTLYSSSFDALKNSFDGVKKCIQATELSEASEEVVEEQLRTMD